MTPQIARLRRSADLHALSCRRKAKLPRVDWSIAMPRATANEPVSRKATAKPIAACTSAQVPAINSLFSMSNLSCESFATRYGIVSALCEAAK